MAGPAVFLGVATHDTIALVDRYPEADERVVVQALEAAGGGPAATAAVACARLGVPAAMVGSVGSDAEGATIVSGLAAEGIDVSGMAVTPGRSGASVVVVDAARATRAICNRPAGVPVLSEAGAALVTSAEWLHVDQLGWLALAPWRDRLSPAARLSVDAGNPIEGFSPAGVALYVPTIAALRHRYGDLAPEALLRAARAEGAEVVVATDGSRGSYGLADGDAVHVPAASGLPIRSTLGAGDVFHGALVAAFVRGMSLRDALDYANHVAAMSCGALDGRSGIPTHEAVLAVLAPTQEGR